MYHVFRAALVSIVLTLTIGQDTPLLCRVFCNPANASDSPCHGSDLGTAPTLRGNFASFGAFGSNRLSGLVIGARVNPWRFDRLKVTLI